jgi:hypothetical protein
MKFRLSSNFNVMEEVRGMKPHTGIDLAMPEGTKLRSLFDGTVERVFHNSGSIGNGVKIHTDHGNIIYGHMKEVDVKIGDKLNSGDFIGLSGNTGNSTGPHLHFGIKSEDGTFLDPTKYAENLANISGDHVEHGKNLMKTIFNPVSPIGGHLFSSVKSRLREHAHQQTIDIVLGIWDGVSDVLVETIGAISLIGCTILIIMRIAGYDKGFKQAGMLFVLNILVKMTIGRK